MLTRKLLHRKVENIFKAHFEHIFEGGSRFYTEQMGPKNKNSEPQTNLTGSYKHMTSTLEGGGT